jgi:hypothetical protein
MMFSCARALGAGLAACVALFVSVAPATVSVASAQTTPNVDGALPAPLPLFPADNWWNADISKAPKDTNSAKFITFIGTTRKLHPDMGASAHDPNDTQQIDGLPYIVVAGTQKLVPVTFRYSGESDTGAPGRPAGYPIPEQVKTKAGWMEGGAPAGSTSTNDSNKGDRHMLIVDKDNKILYELFAAKWNATAKRWEAGSGAVWPLTQNRRRTEGWTSADASGMAILPGLIRYDEAFGTAPIKHALRVTVRATNGFVFPASHKAGSTTGALPMGARLRLKSTVNISSYPAHVQRIFQAMKTYGLIVADNGSDMFITGTSDPRWDAQMGGMNTAFKALNASMFEVVKLGWKPAAAAAKKTTAIELTDGEAATPDASVGTATPDAGGASLGASTPDALATDATAASAAVPEVNGRASTRWLFADGTTAGNFRLAYLLENPGEEPTVATVRYLRSAAAGEAPGEPIIKTYALPARSSTAIDVAQEDPALVGVDLSTDITAESPIVATRAIALRRDAKAALSVRAGVKAPAEQWFLADGATGALFDEYILIGNPNDTPAEVSATYLLPAGSRKGAAPLTKTYTVPPNARFTIHVDAEEFDGLGAALANTSVAATLSSTNPIVVERTMLWPDGKWASFKNAPGATATNTIWTLDDSAAEGQPFISIANTSTQLGAARVTLKFEDGTALVRSYPLAATSRTTVQIATDFPSAAGRPFTAVIESIGKAPAPIVAERATYAATNEKIQARD